MSAHCLSASAESRLVASVDAEDDALVDLGEETVFAEAFKEAGGAAVGSGTRALGSTDLAPGTHRRKVIDEAVDAGWELSTIHGAVRPPQFLVGGFANPLACLAECGDPNCGCNRLKNPGVRGSFAH